jgi:hypothetical protein
VRTGGTRHNIRLTAFLTAGALLLVYLLEAYIDILPDRVEWQNSVVAQLPTMLSVEMCWAASILLSLLAGILICINNTRHFSTKTGVDMLLWFWMIQIFAFPFLHTLTEAHFATVFVLLSHISLFAIDHKSSRNYEKIFLSSMYLGIATLFYTHLAIMLVPNIIAAFRLKRSEYRNCLISLTGFLTPFYFASLICFFRTDNWLYPFETVYHSLIPQIPLNAVDFTKIQIVFGILILALTLIKRLTVQPHSGGVSQKTIVHSQIFTLMQIFALFILFACAPGSKLILPVIFIYTASSLQILFAGIKKRFVATLLVISVAAMSIVHCLLVIN